MNLFKSIGNALRNKINSVKERREERRIQKETEKAIKPAPSSSYPQDVLKDKGAGTIDVASVYRKGRNRRRDIRITQRRFRSERRKLLLINRPGTITELKGERGYWSNKGRFISFAKVTK